MSAIQETSIEEEVLFIAQNLEEEAVLLQAQVQQIANEIAKQGLILPNIVPEESIITATVIHEAFLPVTQFIQEASTQELNEHETLHAAKQSFIDIVHHYPIYNNIDSLEVSKKIIQADSLSKFLSTANQMIENAAVTNQHLFEKTLIESVQQASIEVGFTTITNMSKQSNFTHIVSKADNGSMLVSDVLLENGKYTILSETIGIYDDSCQQILDDFEEKLSKLGVRCHRKSRKDSSSIKQLAKKKVVNTSQSNKKRKVIPHNRQQSRISL